MPLPTARDDRLLVLVFGPGTGELILARAPGDHWLVIDGCAKSHEKRQYAQLALDLYKARPAAIVLTHPHRDHAYGLADLIEEVTTSDPWPLLGMLPPITRPPRAAPSTPSAHATGITERAISAIQTRWEERAACRWDLQLGSKRPLGPATMTVISPAAAGADPNERSTALLLEWRATRIVLGADLEPATAWQASLAIFPQAASHQGLKVAHHGSLKAQEPTLFAPSPGAPRIITPFASEDLPRFDAGGGVALLQQTGADLHLTALPRKHLDQGGRGDARIARTTLATRPELTMDPPVTAFPDCFVAVEWDATGSATLHHGPGSVTVTR